MISDAKLQAAIDDLAFTQDDPESVLYDAAMEARAEVRRLRREKDAISEAADEIVTRLKTALRVIERATAATPERLREIARAALTPKPKRAAKARKGAMR